MENKLFIKEILALTNGIYEVSGLSEGNYDGHSVKYDKLVGNPVYNMIMWGNYPKDYARFCQFALNNHQNGIIADIGCGTLSFTYEVYGNAIIKNLYLCDLSREMLTAGKNRLEFFPRNEDSIIFLRSDALDMPFAKNTLQTVLSFGFLHILEKPEAFLKEIRRILKPGGKLFLTSLCTDRKLSARYLGFLFKKGIVAKPMSSEDVINLISQNGFNILSNYVKGGMVYIEAEIPGEVIVKTQSFRKHSKDKIFVN